MGKPAEISLELPITIPYGKRRYSVNLNIYRNLHFRVLNSLKKKYKEVVKVALKKTKVTKSTIKKLGGNGCVIVYEVHKGDKRRYDVANICSVVDKFFCDSLVELGYLPEDNAKIVRAVLYMDGDIDKSNPRVDVRVLELTGGHSYLFSSICNTLYNS